MYIERVETEAALRDCYAQSKTEKKEKKEKKKIKISNFWGVGGWESKLFEGTAYRSPKKGRKEGKKFTTTERKEM